jgi:16S rRNA (cytosine1402-N4)-methyltransferase
MHIPVLVDEVIEGLAIAAHDVVLDCTVGGAGHSVVLCQRLGPAGRLIGLDKDAAALRQAAQRLTALPCPYTLIQADFRHLDRVLDEVGVTSVSKILLDLGLSSDQLEHSGRGFSFQRDEPLLMTFRDAITAHELTAWQIVNAWSETELAELIFAYGEERWARRIARAIVQARTQRPIDTTHALVAVIKQGVRQARRGQKIHPATRTFQALRMAVNDELEALREGLAKGFARLTPGGRLAVISFHSLEDRTVKLFFKNAQIQQSASLYTKKPLMPSERERQENPRSRSAKLRILVKG